MQLAKLKELTIESVKVSGTGTQDDWNTFHSCLADLMKEAAVQYKEMKENDR